MTNILLVYETEMPSISISRNFWTTIPTKYNIDVLFIRLVDVKSENLDWCDVIVLLRPNNAYSWRIAKIVRNSGRFVITMCDDDLLHLPKSYPDLPWQRKGLIKALKQSSVFLSCNRYLLEQMGGYTTEKRKVYIDTVVKRDELLKRNYYEEKKNVVSIVYAAGGGQHEAMFEQLVLPALENVARKSSKQLSITFISVHPSCGELDRLMDIKYISGMPLFEYRKFMEKNKFDIGVSPLEENSFTRCKYYNKYLEYTLSGIVGIYSKVEPYTYVVQDGINGFLSENNDKAWEEKLTEAIENVELRYECAKNAQNHVREKFDEETIINKLFSDIPEFQSSNLTKKKCKLFCCWRLYYRLLRFIEYLYKFIFYLKADGIGTVYTKILNRLRILKKCIDVKFGKKGYK